MDSPGCRLGIAGPSPSPRKSDFLLQKQAPGQFQGFLPGLKGPFPLGLFHRRQDLPEAGTRRKPQNLDQVVAGEQPGLLFLGFEALL